MSIPTPPELTGTTAGDVMVRRPKTLSPDISIAQARACFADDHVHMLLLTDAGRLMGTLVRDDLRNAVDDTDPALPYSRLHDRTIPRNLPAEQAYRLLRARGQRRLAVVDDDGALLGLLCLKRRLNGFCEDADVAARAAARGLPPVPTDTRTTPAHCGSRGHR